ncbi:Dabb family protein [uncultured Duncaniella sp.]|uniref:Dabb family protein n=1 Tax=uncultured Duncaniella sp. TaxID=2768039 RepID=UPI0026F19EF4|nr:Dabb family protein [uncultured Duncaniella sp.]
MVKHIVSFKFSGTETERKSACDRFKAALTALTEQIGCLESMEVGINENPAETWDLVLIATVPSMEDVKVYAKHPAHVAAAALVKPQIEARACVDYQILETV